MFWDSISHWTWCIPFKTGWLESQDMSLSVAQGWGYRHAPCLAFYMSVRNQTLLPPDHRKHSTLLSPRNILRPGLSICYHTAISHCVAYIEMTLFHCDDLEKNIPTQHKSKLNDFYKDKEMDQQQKVFPPFPWLGPLKLRPQCWYAKSPLKHLPQHILRAPWLTLSLVGRVLYCGSLCSDVWGSFLRILKIFLFVLWPSRWLPHEWGLWAAHSCWGCSVWPRPATPSSA